MGPGSNKWKSGFGVSSAAKKREIPACRGSMRPQAGVKASLTILGAADSNTSSPAREAKEGVGEGVLSAPSLELLVLLGHLT